MVTEEVAILIVGAGVVAFCVLIIVAYWTLSTIEWIQKINNKRR